MPRSGTARAAWLGVLALLALALGAASSEERGGGSAVESKELVVELGGGVKMEFVLIRAGTFMMGSENGRADEKPVHKVTITKPFYLARCEVTQQQWEAVMGGNPSVVKTPRNPVERVGWNDCREFFAKLQEKMSGGKFRLPTEAEWEYACRAGSTTEFCFGDDASLLGEYAWYGGDYNSSPHPVGEKKPNAWGLYDMHGNVLEWCADRYGSYPPSEASDPHGPSSGNERVVRGGSWRGNPAHCRCASRGYGAPTAPARSNGFRAAREL